MTANITWFDVFMSLPVVVLFLASIIPLTIKVLTGNREMNSFATMSYGLAGVVAAGGMILSTAGTNRMAFDGLVVFDGLSTAIGLTIMFVTGLTLVLARENFATNNNQFSEFVFLMLNAAAGMMVVTWANDLMTFFVGIELMSLSLYVLIAMSSEERHSKEAAFKYFVLGSFASAILLYGISFIYGTAGSTQLSVVAETAGQLMASSRLFLLGLVLLIVGIGFKISLFPLHAWTPDVYQGAPTPVTAFMATGVKAATFALFLRVMGVHFLATDQAVSLLNLLQWLAALTMLVGNIAAVMQSNLKRMLAYSSVAHSGYLMIGLLVAGISGEDTVGLNSVVFYLIAYAVMTVGAFGVLSIFEKDENSSLTLDDLKGLAKRRPWLSACLAIFLLSLGGVPPTFGFFGKFFIFAAAVRANLIWLTIWAVISSVIGIYYYLRPIVYMYMREEEGVELPEDKGLSIGFVTGSALLVALLGFFSEPLLQAVAAVLAKVAG